MNKTIAVLWRDVMVAGNISVSSGKMSGLKIINGTGSINNGSFYLESNCEIRLHIDFENAAVNPGAYSTIVNIRTSRFPFSFFLRDVSRKYPIYIPDYGVIITEAGDNRSYEEISAAIDEKKTLTKIQAMNLELEENYENASVATRDLKCPTWLGVSRDIRIFEVGFRGENLSSFFSGSENGLEAWDWIKPRYHGTELRLPELGDIPVQYNFMAGRGLGCAQLLERGLEEGVLPILNASHEDEDICYKMKIFVTNEKRPLNSDTVSGTHYLVADEHSVCHVLTEEQEKCKNQLLKDELERDEETVAYLKIEAINLASTPKYSWVRLPAPNVSVIPERSEYKPVYDGEKGFGCFHTGRVYMVARLNEKPVPQQEMAVLLMPGEKAEYNIIIPHRPVSCERAAELAAQDFDKRLKECIDFWKAKLADAASISVPEKRINEMIQAGLLHLDLVCYGKEPDGAVAPVVGVYSPIGSESSPIIQFMDSMGETQLAKRALMYFFKKQHDDGFMQNFNGYMLETGAVLWNVGEHYRYTGDTEFIKSIKEQIISACGYLIRWREKNKSGELKGKGYGMIDGKVADPQDEYHSYMLNGYAYIGLKRSSEVLREIDMAESDRLAREAEAWREDIRDSLFNTFAESPVIPLGDGRWCPSVSPWPEYKGPLCLYAEGGDWYTHGSVLIRDSLIGPVWLFMQEVISVDELYGKFILDLITEHFNLRNVGFSQPYYSCHPYVHLKRGEVKPFLKEFYNGFSGLADRETYTFWEHYHHVSPHKTHEEAWFLMRCRWMLYMEDGETLNILPGIPRIWLENGKRISLKGVRTYFGPMNLEVESMVDMGMIKVSLSIGSPESRLPRKVTVRIPHPESLTALNASQGNYDKCSECVIIDNFDGNVDFYVNF